jgi:hypothetical protein
MPLGGACWQRSSHDGRLGDHRSLTLREQGCSVTIETTLAAPNPYAGSGAWARVYMA